MSIASAEASESMKFGSSDGPLTLAAKRARPGLEAIGKPRDNATMMPAWLFGTIIVVIGLLFLWQRQRVARLNGWWNKRLGKYGELSSSVATPKYFGIGAVFMVIVGGGIIVYSLVVGGYPRWGDPLTVIVISAIAFVVLVVLSAVLWWRRKAKEQREP